MDKIDQLILRACKVGDAQKRLLSVMRRFYLSTDEDDEFKINQAAMVLLRVVEKYYKVRPSVMVGGLNPNKLVYRMYPDSPSPSYDEMILDTLIGVVRFDYHNQWPEECATPVRFKR